MGVASVDHGSNCNSTPRFLGKPPRFLGNNKNTPSKLPAQLSIWVLFPQQSDIYKKVVLGWVDFAAILRFPMRQTLTAWLSKMC